ncbi:Fur family transcriptional regulator [Spiroplasma sabaudiense Ar-1343]|uniref:Fur family transcriptional regulator n=1 Tax=Spiroplasma sabaudiense Ar-1343 TaxID=1276257 RepID=W6AA87_9MOLU|nr:transcriptional repressor [Spiroplasma sabaudiense]AHI54103.1 Fur family transcriptional regulator [Spiroplasma sabaudiense Ar-1343]
MTLTYEKMVQALKRKGVRLTGARLSIIKVITRKQHVSASAIIKEVESEFGTVNVMSVYNTLDMLLNEHLIFANTFNGKHIIYEVLGDSSIHLKCDLCAKVVHIPESEEQKNLLDEIKTICTSNNLTSNHLKIEAHGMCDTCKKEGKPQVDMTRENKIVDKF